jgi:hypothetical protein
MLFDPAKDYRACLICGEIFQSFLDRLEYRDLDVVADARRFRDEWARKHAKQHSEKEHHLLAISGNTMTPEAANKLAAFGLLPILDMVEDEEVQIALFESNSVPTDDSQ